MNRKKVQIITIVALVIVLIAMISLVLFIRSNQNRIEYYQATIDIDEGGNITVNETLVVNYKSYNNYLIRDIKYNKVDTNGYPYSEFNKSSFSNSKASFDKSSVNVQVYRGNIFDEDDIIDNITNQVDIVCSWDSNPYYDTESGKVRLYSDYLQESICVDAMHAGTLTGLMTFQYSYTIESMVNTYNDCAELNYVLFDAMDMTIKEADVSVILPKQVTDSSLRGYGHGLSNGKIYVNEQSVSYEAKNITIDEAFEVRVLFPTGIVNETTDNHVNIEIKNLIINYEEKLAKLSNTSYILNYVCIGLTAFVFVIMIIVTIVVYIKYDKEFKPEFDGIYQRDLPYDYSPAICGYVYNFGATNDEDVTAVLLDLINRKYLKYEPYKAYNGKKEITDGIISINQEKATNDLLPFELDIYNLFINVIGNGNDVKVSDIENYGKKYSEATQIDARGKVFMNDVKKEADKQEFILIQNKKALYSFVIIPIIAIIFMLLVKMIFQVPVVIEIIALAFLMVAYVTYVTTFKKRTHKGAEHYARWKAFKKFLEDFSNMSDYEIPSIEIWEQYLVYATSLGVSKKVMEQLKVKLPQLSEMSNIDFETNFYFNTYFLFYSMNRINHSYRACRSNSINAISQHNSSSHGGHGGGFSGGSSFGGGGGGFHGGR